MNKNINNPNTFNDLSINTDDLDRKAYRAVPKNLWVYLDGDNTPHKVHNISFSGVCFEVNKLEKNKELTPGALITIYLFSELHDEIITLSAQAMRIDEGLCSCFFPIIVDRDQTMLDKIIIEIQKNNIMEEKALQKQKQKEEEKVEAGHTYTKQEMHFMNLIKNKDSK